MADSLEMAPSAPESHATRRKIGRPSKYTSDRVERILTYLRGGNTRRAAGLASGISHETFSQWLHLYPEFAEQVTCAEAEAETTIVGTVVKAAMTGQWGAATWWLERRRHEDWSQKRTVEHTITMVRELARATGHDEDAAVQAAQEILRELRAAART